jgi:hypothetical protein
MARNTLIGINGIAKKADKIYIGVGELAKKAKRGYIGINGFAKLFYTGDPILIYENSTAGTYAITLAAGKYEITLIGGGGGGAGMRSSSVSNHHYAQGGVGGTLQFIANLATTANLQIVVGAGGSTASGTFSGAGSATTGTAGGASTITGFLNLAASAGGGKAGSIAPTSSSATNRTPGAIGTNSVGGIALLEALIDNPDPCTSLQGTSTGTSRTPTGRVNSNWPTDTSRGKSGDSGWNNTSFLSMMGAAGYVRIVML